jgi:hypothetical protein
MSNFMKILLVGAELFRANGRTDGRTDVTKLIVSFRNFASVPKIVQSDYTYCMQHTRRQMAFLGLANGSKTDLSILQKRPR